MLQKNLAAQSFWNPLSLVVPLIAAEGRPSLDSVAICGNVDAKWCKDPARSIGFEEVGLAIGDVTNKKIRVDANWCCVGLASSCEGDVSCWREG